jgi:uncharacterized protein
MNVVLAGLTVGLFWVGVFVARSFGRKAEYSLAPLGIAWPKGGLLLGIALGALVGVGSLLVSRVVNPASAFVLERLGYSTDSTVQQPFMRGLARWVEHSPDVAIPAIIFVVVIFGPAVEELVFRGAIFNGLYRLGALIRRRNPGGSESSVRKARRVRFILAALASSVLFAALHLEPVLVPALVILAVSLCALFQRTGSLLPPFVAHATFNSLAVLLIILTGLGVFKVPV